jgi:hypothetical protein
MVLASTRSLRRRGPRVAATACAAWAPPAARDCEAAVGASFDALGPPVAPEYLHDATGSNLLQSSHGSVALHAADHAQWCDFRAKFVE